MESPTRFTPLRVKDGTVDVTYALATRFKKRYNRNQAFVEEFHRGPSDRPGLWIDWYEPVSGPGTSPSDMVWGEKFAVRGKTQAKPADRQVSSVSAGSRHVVCRPVSVLSETQLPSAQQSAPKPLAHAPGSRVVLESQLLPVVAPPVRENSRWLKTKLKNATTRLSLDPLSADPAATRVVESGLAPPRAAVSNGSVLSRALSALPCACLGCHPVAPESRAVVAAPASRRRRLSKRRRQRQRTRSSSRQGGQVEPPVKRPAPSAPQRFVPLPPQYFLPRPQADLLESVRLGVTPLFEAKLMLRGLPRQMRRDLWLRLVLAAPPALPRQ
jgi:hypothetical protein